ncbi:unnamed protein product, partial [Medioppia subpectinata]
QQLAVREEDVIRLVLEFLSVRELSISQLSVERETGLNNGVFSDDLLFLRQLILDGQWDDVLAFVQPIEAVDAFDAKRFQYLIHKHKYIELLCIRSEAGPIHNVEIAVNDVVDTLNHLERLCPTREEYNEMCLLLTVPNLCQLKEYKRWNPSNWRINCFKAVLPLIEKYLPVDRKSVADNPPKTAKGDRLMQLIIKGILYESCVEYCEQKASTFTGKRWTQMKYSDVLDGTGFNNSDLSLLSWLQSLPMDTFSHPFEQKTLNVEVEQLEKPSLMASWSELILVTPIKPKVFPHSATPFTRRKASDLMSKSLTPGLVDGLTKSIMNFSISDMTAMSRSSFATTGFHLNSNNNNNAINNSVNNNSNGNKSVNKSLQTSVDRLFEGDEVFSSSCFQRLPTISEKASPVSTLSGEESRCVSSANQSVILSPNSCAKDVNSGHNPQDLWLKFQKEKQKLLEKLGSDDDSVVLSATTTTQMTPNDRNTFVVQTSAHGLRANTMQTPVVCSDMNEKVTPIGQTGQSNYPNPQRLTTSTPKGNYQRMRETPNFVITNQSPICQTNGSHNKNISFNNSMDEMYTNTNSNITSSHQSSQPMNQFSAHLSQQTPNASNQQTH